jgi:hypothetical protein
LFFARARRSVFLRRLACFFALSLPLLFPIRPKDSVLSLAIQSYFTISRVPIAHPIRFIQRVRTSEFRKSGVCEFVDSPLVRKTRTDPVAAFRSVPLIVLQDHTHDPFPSRIGSRGVEESEA